MNYKIDKKHREVFFNMTLGIQLLYHEVFGTETEYPVGHIMLEINNLADHFGAEDGEMLAIVHNAGMVIQGKPQLDIDECIQRHKLLDILKDTEFTNLILPPTEKI